MLEREKWYIAVVVPFLFTSCYLLFQFQLALKKIDIDCVSNKSKISYFKQMANNTIWQAKGL